MPRLEKKISKPHIQDPNKITAKTIKAVTGEVPEVLTDPNGLKILATPCFMLVPDNTITDELTTEQGSKIPAKDIHRLYDRAINNPSLYSFKYEKEDLFLLNACLQQGGRKANLDAYNIPLAILNEHGLSVTHSLGDDPEGFHMSMEYGVTRHVSHEDQLSIPVWLWVKTGITNGRMTWNKNNQPMVILNGPGFHVIFNAYWV